MKKLEKYSFGVGDRFEMETDAQLDAIIAAQNIGIAITPVWNKSNREHHYVNSEPSKTREAVDKAIKEKNWQQSYFLDADHINLSNVDKFIDYCDFFTIDVADYIGKIVDNSVIDDNFKNCKSLIGINLIDNLVDSINLTEEQLHKIVCKFAPAIEEAAKIYNHIKQNKGNQFFVTEISMDEVDEAQSPTEMLVILKLIAAHNIPVDTIAPKFTGRFNKGVDYVGDIVRFEKEFEADLLVIEHAVKHFGLSENLKLSIHSGSDKFSIYPIMGKLIMKYNKGIHVKTAGTNWLEEVIGLAKAGGSGLEMAKEIYSIAFGRIDELAKPYSSVLDIDPKKLPEPSAVNTWSSQQFVNALQHEQNCAEYNVSLRQLIHVGYKIAAENKDRYLALVQEHKAVISKCVAYNIFERHIKRLFL